MKKVFLTLILTILPLLASAEAVEIDGIWYNLVPKAKEAEVTINPNKYSENVEIPQSVSYEGITYRVTCIKSIAFAGCSGLTSVTIPNSVTSIGEDAFRGCSGLTSVTIPNSVTSIDRGAFSSCSGLTSVTIPNSVTSICIQAFKNCSNLTSVTIPNSVTSIGESAFYGCSGLTSVTIPNSVTHIEREAFHRCSGLTSVTIGTSVSYIGNYAFAGCSSLTSVYIFDIKAWCELEFSSSDSNPFFYAHHLYLDGEEVEDLVIPNSVTSISSQAFKNCSNMTSVTIPNSVTSIGESAFSGCSGLTSVTIGNSVTSIGGYSFKNCSGLTSVTIPNSMTSIGNYAFYACSNLTSVTIPNSVTSIGQQAFANCDELMDVFCMAEKLRSHGSYDKGVYTDPSAFEGSYPQAMTLHVPAASIEAYRSTEPWSQFKAFVALEDGDIPTTQKCATPEISYADGKLDFICETEGVEFVSEVIVGDAKKYYDASVTLSQTYKVTVYAVKTGYENSDIVTREIVIENGQSSLFGDLNKDGKVDVADHVKLSDIIMNK